MNEIILCKYGELALKGLNRTSFESVLLKNIKKRLNPLGNYKIYSAQSTVYIEPEDDFFDIDEAFDRAKILLRTHESTLKKVATDKNLSQNDIINKALDAYLARFK